MAMMGMVFASSRSRARMARVASCPFMTGICTSIRMASKPPRSDSWKRSTANRPFPTTTQEAPSMRSTS